MMACWSPRHAHLVYDRSEGRYRIVDYHCLVRGYSWSLSWREVHR